MNEESSQGTMYFFPTAGNGSLTRPSKTVNSDMSGSFLKWGPSSDDTGSIKLPYSVGWTEAFGDFGVRLDSDLKLMSEDGNTRS